MPTRPMAIDSAISPEAACASLGAGRLQALQHDRERAGEADEGGDEAGYDRLGKGRSAHEDLRGRGADAPMQGLAPRERPGKWAMRPVRKLFAPELFVLLRNSRRN